MAGPASDSFPASPSLDHVGDDCLLRIRQVLPTLDGARRRVADYVLANAWEARGLSISNLAERSGSSENAVTRFVRALGYSGYRDFIRALSMDLGKVIGAAYSLPAIPANGTPLDVAAVFSRVFDLEIECLRDTAANVDRQSFESVVQTIAQAQRIVLFGMGSTAPLCAMAGYRLLHIGLNANWSSDPMVMTVLAGFLRPGDVAIGISYSGRSRATVEALKLSASTGATAMALTTVAGSPITEAASITLVAFAPNVALGSGQFAARVAGMALLDAMVAAVSWVKYRDTPPHMQEVVAIQGELNDLPTKRIRDPERRKQTETTQRLRTERENE